MSEAAYQDEQYDKAMGIGYDIDPETARMQCIEPDCRHEWECGLTADFNYYPPMAVPLVTGCKKCGSDGNLLTDHRVSPYT